MIYAIVALILWRPIITSAGILAAVCVGILINIVRLVLWLAGK